MVNESLEKSKTVLPGAAVEWALIFKRNRIVTNLLRA